MGFWDEELETVKDPKYPSVLDSRTRTGTEGIYRTASGKFKAYARKWGKQHHIGTYSTFEIARSAQETFHELGTKIKEEQPKETLEELIAEHLAVHSQQRSQ